MGIDDVGGGGERGVKLRLAAGQLGMQDGGFRFEVGALEVGFGKCLDPGVERIVL